MFVSWNVFFTRLIVFIAPFSLSQSVSSESSVFVPGELSDTQATQEYLDSIGARIRRDILSFRGHLIVNIY